MPTQQIIFWGTTDDPLTSTKEYITPGINGVLWSTSTSVSQGLAPTSGTFKHLRVRFGQAPGAAASGKKWTVALNVNGIDSTNLTVDVLETATEASITADESISALDKLSISCTPTSTPSSALRVDISLVWEPTTDGEYIYMGNAQNTTLPGTVEYTGFQNASNTFTWSTNETLHKQLCPASGVFKKLSVATTASPGTGNVVYTIRSNNSGSNADTSQAVTINSGNFSTGATSAGADATIAAGNDFSIKADPDGTTTGVSSIWGIVFVPTTAGEIPLFGGHFDNLNSTTTEYCHVEGGRQWDATESNRYVFVLTPQDFTATAAYVESDAAPGTGDTYDFDIMVNSSPEASLNLQLSGASQTTDNVTGQSVTLSDGDTLSIRSAPTGTPATPDVTWGYVINYGSQATILPIVNHYLI